MDQNDQRHLLICEVCKEPIRPDEELAYLGVGDFAHNDCREQKRIERIKELLS